MRTLTVLIVLLLALSALGFVAVAPPAQAATTNLSDQLVESAGPTNAFGGGNYRFIEFGSDAAFGIVWGNATHANHIYVVAIKARYLGVGQVYNANGTLLLANHLVKVYTVYAAQIQNLVEYQNLSDSGVANYTRAYNSTTRTWSGYAFSSHDTGYKYVNLSANWIPSPVTRTTGSSYRTWSFSLNATNLAYYNITNKVKLTNLQTPIVNFTFHLNASLVQVDNVGVPQWNITVSQIGGQYRLTDVAPRERLTLASLKTVHYGLKWDQLIDNWAYDKRDNNPAARRLLLEVGMIVGNYVPPGVITGWRLIHQLQDDGTAQYNGTSGPQTVGNTTGTLASPQRFRSPDLEFGGMWTQIGRFQWTSTSSVDGVARNVTAQIGGGWHFTYVDARGAWFGFVLLVGLSFYGGTSIVHDPTVAADVATDPVFQQAPSPSPGPTPGAGGNLGALVIGILVVVALVLVAFAMLIRRKKEPEPPVQPPTPPPPS